jgi:hypothetical protein
MRLTDTLNKIKVSVPYLPDLPKDLFIIAFILLATIGSFMLGRLSLSDEKHKNGLKITRTELLSGTLAGDQNGIDSAVLRPGTISKSTFSGEVSRPPQLGMYVGAKSGKTYYLPWCSGVKRIHEENKIWFKDKVDAESKGYKPSSACKGI